MGLGNLKPALHHDGTTKTLTFGRKSGGGRSGPTTVDQCFFGTHTRDGGTGPRTNVVLLLGNGKRRYISSSRRASGQVCVDNVLYPGFKSRQASDSGSLNGVELQMTTNALLRPNDSVLESSIGNHQRSECVEAHTRRPGWGVWNELSSKTLRDRRKLSLRASRGSNTEAMWPATTYQADGSRSEILVRWMSG
jgi:hypothetical protein